VCDLETSRIGASYIYDFSHLRVKERRGYSRFKKEALDRIIWRARFGRGSGPVVRQITELINALTQHKSRRNTSADYKQK
jgi:hypothetical protein